jgi:uncharacterized protein (DUF2249 family)
MANDRIYESEWKSKKKCSKCGEIKSIDSFCKDKYSSDGVSYQCKECRKTHWAKYYREKGDELRCKYIAYHNANSDKKKAYRDKTKDHHRKVVKAWAQKNESKIKKKNRDYADANRDTICAKARERYHSILKYDEKFQLKRRMAKGIRRTLVDGKKGRSWEQFVDYDVKKLMSHLKKTMPDGYSWEDFQNNPSGFHIDHIIPVDAFNFDTVDQIDFRKCWALKNLRLIPAKDNLAKGNRLESPFQPSLNLVFASEST